MNDYEINGDYHDEGKEFKYYLEKIRRFFIFSKNRLRVHAEPVYNYIEDVIKNTKDTLWVLKWIFILLSFGALILSIIVWATLLAADKYCESNNGWWFTMPFIALIILMILIPRRL